MNVIQTIVGFIGGALFLGVFQRHGFWQAFEITLVYTILVVLVHKWLKGEFDKTEMDYVIEKDEMKFKEK